ncbi:MAG: hypothetical protein QOI95_3266 [Acidimicrobiaceae bacterium]|jgi:hypothetical protein
MTALRRPSRRIALFLVVATLTWCAGCGGNSDNKPRATNSGGATSNGQGATQIPSQILLASSFEQPICGTYQHPGPGCEFGFEGDDLKTGSFNCRTGPNCLQLGRLAQKHMGVIRVVPLPDGHAFIGVAHRVPELAPGVIPEVPGYLEIMQMSPTDGTTQRPGYPVEVRLHSDRRLGLALFQGPDEVLTEHPVPVDEWFYTLVEVTNGVNATQRLWVYGADDKLIDSVEIPLDTAQENVHAARMAQKVGGVTSTTRQFYTYEDDWYIATTNGGPLHIDTAGQPVH